MDNKLASAPPRAPNESNNPLTLICQAFSCASTPDSILLAVISALSIYVGRYINKDIQRDTKLALELFIQGQEYAPTQTALN